MGDGPPLVHQCLLDMHGSLTYLAKNGIFLGVYNYTGQIENLCHNTLLEGMRLLSQRGKRFQGGSAVFFPAFSPCWE